MERGSVVFFALSSLVNRGMGDRGGLGIFYGWALRKFVDEPEFCFCECWLLCGIMLFLSAGASDGNNSRGGMDEDDSSQHSKLYGSMASGMAGTSRKPWFDCWGRLAERRRLMVPSICGKGDSILAERNVKELE